jgi:hypothetical protein
MEVNEWMHSENAKIVDMVGQHLQTKDKTKMEWEGRSERRRERILL